MQADSKDSINQLSSLKKTVEHFHDYWRENIETFNQYRKFFFKTTLTGLELDVLTTRNMPVVEFNIGQAHCNRLIGEWSRQEPSPMVSSDEGATTDPNIIKLVEDHLRYAIRQSDNNGMRMDVYKDQISGGYSVMKIWTEYDNEMSFNQTIKFGRAFDPTLCGFDLLARAPHKGDGRYCFEIIPKRLEDAEKEFGISFDDLSFLRSVNTGDSISNFSWSYSADDQEKILLICDMYEKVPEEIEIIKLSNNEVIYADDYEDFVAKWKENIRIQVPPTIIDKRKTTINKIKRTVFCENKILKEEETDYPGLPLIFVDGNSIEIRDSQSEAAKQVIQPYLYNIKGLQKLKNFAGQSLANELENSMQHKIMISQQALPTQDSFQDAYRNMQQASTLVWNEFVNNNPDMRTTPPQVIARPPIPPEIMNTFMACDQMIQNLLGSYDAAVGAGDPNQSGEALKTGALNSNYAAMPYMIGFTEALTQICQMYVQMIPKYFTTPMSLPILGKDGRHHYLLINQNQQQTFDYDDHVLKVKIEAGPNFSIQRSQTLNMIISLCQASPIFANFFNTVGLPIILDNMELRGIDFLKEQVPEYQQKIEEQQKQAAQNNPEQMKMQVEQMKLQQKAQQDQANNALRQQEMELERYKTQNDALKIALDAKIAHEDSIAQIDKANAERMSKAADLAMAHIDQTHRHGKESVELGHSLLNAEHNRMIKENEINTNRGEEKNV